MQVISVHPSKFPNRSNELAKLLRGVGLVYHSLTVLMGSIVLVTIILVLLIPFLIGLYLFIQWSIFQLKKEILKADFSVSQENYSDCKEFHKVLLAHIDNLSFADKQEKFIFTSPFINQAKNLRTLFQEIELKLREGLYSNFNPDISQSQILEGRKSLEKFGKDWEDEDMDIYDQVYN